MNILLLAAAVAHSVADATYLDALAIARSIEQNSGGKAACHIQPDSPTIVCTVDGSPTEAYRVVKRVLDNVTTQDIDVESSRTTFSPKQIEFSMTLATPDG